MLFRSLCAIRINGAGTPEHEADIAAVAATACDFVVVPKVEQAGAARAVAAACAKPVLAMIETPAGVLAAAAWLEAPKGEAPSAAMRKLVREAGIKL